MASSTDGAIYNETTTIWMDAEKEKDFNIQVGEKSVITTDGMMEELVPMTKSHDSRLWELEQQLEVAEARCGTLKQQLDYMKMMYQGRIDRGLEIQYSENNEVKGIKTDTKGQKDPFSILKTIDELSSKSPAEKEDPAPPISDFVSPAVDFEPSILPEAPEVIKGTLTDKTEVKPVDYLTVAAIESNSPDLAKTETIAITTNSMGIPVTENVSKTIEKIDSGKRKVSYRDFKNSGTDKISNIKGESGAVKVIQDILFGITESVNRISQLSIHASDNAKKEQRKHSHHLPIQTISKSTSPCINMHTKHSVVPGSTVYILPEHPCSASYSDPNVEYILKTNADSEFAEFNHHHKHRHHRRKLSSRGSSQPPEDHFTRNKRYSTEDTNVHNASIKLKPKHWYKPQENEIEIEPGEEVEFLRENVTEDYQNDTKNTSTNPGTERTNYSLQRISDHYKSKTREDPFSVTTQIKRKCRKARITTSHSIIPDNKSLRNASNNVSNKNLVELYHNQAIRMSSASDLNKKIAEPPDSPRSYIQPEKVAEKCSHETLNVHSVHNSVQCNMQLEDQQTSNTQSGQTETLPEMQFHSLPSYVQAPRRNFAMPTLSSKLKQVEKTYFQRFSFRNIPFVVGTSTTPSHNLGLNIQQALSIIKLRHPMPNLGGEVQQDTTSTIFSRRPSTAASYLGHKGCCPAALAHMQRPHSQPMAENSDLEYILHEEKSERTFNSEGEPVPGTFASLLKSQGDNSTVLTYHEKKDCVWNLDQPDDNTQGTCSKIRCTCFPTRPCIDYQKLLSDYLENGEGGSFFQMLMPTRKPLPLCQARSMSRSRVSSAVPPNMNISEILSQRGDGILKDFESGDNHVLGQLQERSQGLRQALLSMHEDFRRLHKKYEQLQSDVDQENVDETEAAKELEKMESELQTREDEIIVVMSLYKEVMSLKEQVKTLRTRTSSPSVVVKSQASRQREPTVSVRLTRLLRSVQNFQEKLLQD